MTLNAFVLFATWDAWNRLASVTSATSAVIFSYDGDWKRLKKTVGTNITEYYYDDMQLAETKTNGVASEQFVYDTRYLHSVALRDRDTDGDGNCTDAGGSERLFYCNDGNFNVTALVSTNGTVVERYTYDPYGKVTIRDANWQPITWDASQQNVVLYTGHKFDAESGLYYSLYRYYHPGLGRWAGRDPIASIHIGFYARGETGMRTIGLLHRQVPTQVASARVRWPKYQFTSHNSQSNCRQRGQRRQRGQQLTVTLPRIAETKSIGMYIVSDNNPVRMTDPFGLTATYCEQLATAFNTGEPTGDDRIDSIGTTVRGYQPVCKTKIRCLNSLSGICGGTVSANGCLSIEGEDWNGSTKPYPQFGTCYANVCQKGENDRVRGTIRHELMHCWQSCISKDYNQENCNDVLCTEVAAHNYSDICNGPGMIAAWGGYENCLKGLAKGSSANMDVCNGQNLDAILNSTVGSSPGTPFVAHCIGSAGVLP